MAKSVATADQTSELATTTELVTSEIFSPNSLEAIMAEYGITESDVTVPKPPTTLKQNFEQLCELTTEVVDERGNSLGRVNGHTGPLMFLSKKGESNGDKYAGYDGFYIYELLHPSKGKTVVTIGRPIGENKPAIVAYLDTLQKGAMFQVASFATSAGFKVFQAVPVQVDGKLLSR